MTRVASASAGPLPRWLVIVGSLAICYHLAAIIIPILDVPSAWSSPMGRSIADPPAFAHALGDLSGVHARLRVTHSYHFVSDRPGDLPGVEFEVRLRDREGKV